jgi:hypothetical protein
MPEATPSAQKFRYYYRNVMDKASEIGGDWIRDNFVVPAVLLLLSAVYAYFAYQLRPDWQAIVPVLWINGTIIILFSFGFVVRAAWRLDNERLSEIEALKAFKNEKEDSRVRLEFQRLVVRDVLHIFPDGNSWPAYALRMKILNRASKLPGKTATNVLAKVTYEDEDGNTFNQFGRWADSDQPEKLSYLDSKNTLLPMSFLPGSEHELDIAAKFLEDFSCYGVNNDSFPKIRHDTQQLDGPIVAVKVELTAEHVQEEFRFSFTNLGVGKGFLIPESSSLPTPISQTE